MATHLPKIAIMKLLPNRICIINKIIGCIAQTPTPVVTANPRNCVLIFLFFDQKVKKRLIAKLMIIATLVDI